MAAIIELRPTSLALETCRAEHIDNTRNYEISANRANEIAAFDNQYGAVIERRHVPTPIYNCHGLTFASRRTGIFDTQTLWQILREDGYIEISKEQVLAGDVIMYFNETGDDFEHSGIVIVKPNADNLYIPLVCSKWGHYAEVLHLANNCPYTFANVKYYRLQS